MATHLKLQSDIGSQILDRIGKPSSQVWTPSDFVDLGTRTAIDKALQRLVANREIRRIDRGLYDRPTLNRLAGKPNVPDYRAVIDAVARRDNARIVIDGMTAANDLGLTNAVPGKIEVLVDGRFKPIRLGNQEIHFKHAAPSRLHWAGRPGMRVVQALHWLRDVLADEEENRRVSAVLNRLFDNGTRGREIRDDLKQHLGSLPIWMQDFLRPLLR